MSMKRSINQVLRRTTGYEIVRKGTGARRVVQAQRQLRSPVFVLSSIRSGSTLLRVMLGSHSEIFAPHEMHLGNIQANADSWFAEAAVQEAGLDEQELTHMMWDAMLARMLRDSGKSVLVEKTPYHVFLYRKIAATWPDARFVFLLRHPGSIHQSWQEAHPSMSADEVTADVLRYVKGVEQARTDLPGLDVTYEELVSDPEGQTRRLCAFLGVAWEPEMVEYGKRGHTRFRRGLGDWSGKIRSGRPQEGRALPSLDEVPAELRPYCEKWGY
ncbi:sulfotransferase family protein [Actinocatenispora rupis]|uniref:Sulfotransferase family protein n=1 Tax=Actinocatenispora rupis TaxID=519421 RepID=A0A8J3JA19_9ACTN|nr:sulfotransferase [Actinocatenispora rupis]GID14620.1 sulfotransferase family protein [Actinocatenispora rupis]